MLDKAISYAQGAIQNLPEVEKLKAYGTLGGIYFYQGMMQKAH